jgi:hypothetical protein
MCLTIALASTLCLSLMRQVIDLHSSISRLAYRISCLEKANPYLLQPERTPPVLHLRKL